jgi:hypothetical protein
MSFNKFFDVPELQNYRGNNVQVMYKFFSYKVQVIYKLALFVTNAQAPCLDTLERVGAAAAWVCWAKRKRELARGP